MSSATTTTTKSRETKRKESPLESFVSKMTSEQILEWKNVLNAELLFRQEQGNVPDKYKVSSADIARMLMSALGGGTGLDEDEDDDDEEIDDYEDDSSDDDPPSKPLPHPRRVTRPVDDDSDESE